MVQLFAKRFWGFDPVNWPIVSFGLEANRDSLVSLSKAGDLIAFIGTQSVPTAPEDQGRLLGMAEIGRIPINSLDVLDRAAITPASYNANGRFKWPKALPMLRAWYFPDKPLMRDVLEDQLTYEATVRAVLLDARDQQAVLRLRSEETEVPDLDILHKHRSLADALASRGPTTGPAPSSWSGNVERNASMPATTYALRFGKRDVWKIGHAQDVAGRLNDVNRHVPHEAIGEHWSIAWKQTWQNQSAAFEMEQRVLALLSVYRTEGERISCSEDRLRQAWVGSLIPY